GVVDRIGLISGGGTEGADGTGSGGTTTTTTSTGRPGGQRHGPVTGPDGLDRREERQLTDADGVVVGTPGVIGGRLERGRTPDPDEGSDRPWRAQSGGHVSLRRAIFSFAYVCLRRVVLNIEDSVKSELASGQARSPRSRSCPG